MADQSPIQNYNLPPEYTGDIDAAQRRLALAQLLQKQSLGFQGAQSQGPVAAKTSPIAWIANAAAGALGNTAATNSMRDIRNVELGAANAQRQELANVLSLPEDQQFAAAQQGHFPQTQALAKLLEDRRQGLRLAGIKAVGEGGDTAGAVKLAAGAPLSSYAPRAMPTPVFGSVPGPNGPIPTVVNTDKFGAQSGHLSGGSTVTVGNAEQLAAAKALGGQVPAVAEKASTDAATALDKISNYNKIYALADDPQTVTGFAAGSVLGLTALGAKLGLTGADAPAKTQELLTLMAKQTLASSTLLKGSISDKEKPFLEQAASGGISYTPAAIKRIAQMSAAVEHNKVIYAYRQHRGTVSQPGAAGAADMYPFPSLEHTLPGMDTSVYKEMPNGMVQYIGGGMSSPATAGGAPAAVSSPEVLSLDEFHRRYPNLGK